MKDERKRSVLKGLTWRVVATSDTIFLSWFFTGSITAALSIGALELVTKTVLYYAHERAWINIPTLGGKKFLARSLRRTSIMKAISWRFFGALDTIFLATIVTGDIGIAASIGAVEVFTKILLYYGHDRLWSRVAWGKTNMGT
ncbi:MAG: putative membrane protein [Candidatus Azotimanducaceae bacterium]|jgi:uncharacterized membrane protein